MFLLADPALGSVHDRQAQTDAFPWIYPQAPCVCNMVIIPQGELRPNDFQAKTDRLKTVIWKKPPVGHHHSGICPRPL